MRNLLTLTFVFFMLTSAYSADVKMKTKDKGNQKYLDFELPDLSSKQNFKLSTIVGKKLVLLHFWTTWCPFCRAEISALNNLHGKYKDRGLAIVSVNIRESKNTVSKFTSSKGINYIVLLDQKAEVADMYGIRGIPTNFIINLKGEVIFKGHELPDEKTIEENLPVEEVKVKDIKGKKKSKK